MFSSLPVVFFSDLDHAELAEDGFTKVSYGDAEWTLVYAQDLIDELENRDNGCCHTPLAGGQGISVSNVD